MATTKKTTTKTTASKTTKTAQVSETASLNKELAALKKEVATLKKTIAEMKLSSGNADTQLRNVLLDWADATAGDAMNRRFRKAGITKS